MRVIHAANTHRLQVYEWQQTQSLGKKKKKNLHTLEIIHTNYTTKPAYNVQTHPKRQDFVSYFFSFLLYLSTNRNIRTRLHQLAGITKSGTKESAWLPRHVTQGCRCLVGHRAWPNKLCEGFYQTSHLFILSHVLFFQMELSYLKSIRVTSSVFTCCGMCIYNELWWKKHWIIYWWIKYKKNKKK